MNDVVRSAPAQGFGDTLMKLLADPNIPADKLQVMLQMQRELLAERRKEAFQTAFVAMSAKMPQVTKEGLIDLSSGGTRRGSYKYAKWEDMDTVIRPILVEFGFALNFYEPPENGLNGKDVTVRGVLMHVDGHSVESQRSAPPDAGPGRNSLQAIGSTITYLRRYIGEGLCNIVRRGIDDDGKSAISKPITPAQIKELTDLLKAVKTQPDTFLRLFVTGCEKMEEIPERDFPRLVNALREKQRSMK